MQEAKQDNKTPCTQVGEIRMQIDSNTALERENNFKIYKKDILDSAFNYHHPTKVATFKISDFLNLIQEIIQDNPSMNGIRFYISTYVKKGTGLDEHIPNGEDNFLTLIIAPTKTIDTILRNDTGIFYSIAPNKSNKRRIRESLNPKIKDWVDCYKYGHCVLLSPELHNGSDTKRLWIAIELVTEWLEEMNCQKSHGADIEEIIIKWGSYGLNQSAEFLMPNNQKQTFNVDRQLTIFFEVPNATVFKKINVLADYDTAFPCPPYTGCEQGTSF